MQAKEVIINFTGGIVSLGYLREILLLAQEAKVQHVRFGLRQQMRMDMPAKSYKAFMDACVEKGIAVYNASEAPPNIVSSYPAADLFTSDSWMREGVYKDIFDSLSYKPQLKVNICDNQQTFVPLCSGHINWVSSSSQHFWYLYIRFPKTATLYKWKQAIYTNDIPHLSQAIENEILLNKDLFYGNEKANGDALYSSIKTKVSYIGKEATEEALPDFSLPYYEGFNRTNNHFWLGIYRRNETFSVSFLLDVCNLCLQTRIGQLYTTTWKSLIVKGIDPAHRKHWDSVLGQYRINVRHAANELAWQVEDDTEKGLQLKNHIIRHFDKEDVRTFGLCFAVQTKPSTSLFGSVVIRLQQNKNPHRLKTLERYDILYKKDFNPNNNELILFRDGVEKDFLGTYLVSLCKCYYEGQAATPLLIKEAELIKAEIVEKTAVIHQCRHCQTVYVPALGDEAQGVEPGTYFEHLPVGYNCPLCEAPKDSFVEVEALKGNRRGAALQSAAGSL